MQQVSDATNNLLDNVEHFAQRKLRYRTHVAQLIELARERHQQRLFEDTIFLAKFLWNASGIMHRIGPADQGYPKLAAEFRDAVEKFSTLVKTLAKESPDEVKQSFILTFFAMTQESMDHLIALAADLSSVKNYIIDTKQPLFR